MAYQGEEIVNPRTGQRMVFLQTAEDTDGALLQLETVNPGHSPAEPEHVHPLQESSAEVIAGALYFSVRGEIQIVRAGDKIVIPPNTPHSFWNGGDVDARAVQEFRPALRIESFFETWFGLAHDGKLNEKGMPSVLQLAVMVPGVRRRDASHQSALGHASGAVVASWANCPGTGLPKHLSVWEQERSHCGYGLTTRRNAGI